MLGAIEIDIDYDSKPAVAVFVHTGRDAALDNGQWRSRLQSRNPSPEVIQRFQEAGYHQVAARILAARMDNPESVKPTLRSLSNPNGLPDIENAVTRIMALLESTDQICVLVCDHDVDGVTSQGVLTQALLSYGLPEHRLHCYIGHRLKEGYGLSDGVVDRILADLGRAPDVVITADCGSSDEARIARLSELGADVIVTDHHEIPKEGIPTSALAVVSPTRSDSYYDDPKIAGVMVAWLLMTVLRSRLKQTGRLPDDAVEAADLLDLVSLGTVADCVDLNQSINNRIVVRYGLRLIQDARRPCWRVASNWLQDGRRRCAQDLAFGIGPRINARGRLDEAMAGVRFLLSESDSEARKLGNLLDTENDARKQIERSLTTEAIDLANEQVSAGKRGLSLWLEQGHPGVHGIVASRITERFGHPSVCISPHFVDKTMACGSVRGIDNFHVRDALQKIEDQHPGLLAKFGGHAGAAGLSLKRSDVERFTAAFHAVCEEMLASRDLMPAVYHDGDIDPADINMGLLQELQDLDPYGRGFDAPLFQAEFKVLSARAVGDGTHLSLCLSGGGNHFRAIWFGALNEQRALPVAGHTITLLFAIEENHFQGRSSVQLRVLGEVV